MTATTFINFHKDNDEIIRLEAGCIVSDTHGVYALSNFVRLAQRFGFTLDENDERAVARYESGDDMDGEDEAVGWIVSECEEYLNARLEDGYVTWYEGGVYLEPAASMFLDN